MDFASAVVALAAIAYYVRPGNRAAQVIEAAGKAQADAIRSAIGGSGSVVKDLRSAAERFHDKATDAIGDFWKGFTDEC